MMFLATDRTKPVHYGAHPPGLRHLGLLQLLGNDGVELFARLHREERPVRGDDEHRGIASIPHD